MNVLREYLYVDSEKVKGIASQLFDGVPDSSESSQKQSGRGQIGPRSIAFVAKGHEEDITEHRLLSDAMFPRIEEVLEAEGYLVDISEIVAEGEAFSSGLLRRDYPAGAIVRITAEGRLVDPRYFGRMMMGFATAVSGFSLMGIKRDGPTSSRPAGSGGSRQSKNAGPGKNNSSNLEDQIPDIGSDSIVADSIKTSDLRGMVKIMRGLYPEGLSMVLSPAGDAGANISLRLQEGRQYLDAEPDVLFARYGLDSQDWTVVGVIGYHAEAGDISSFDDVVDPANGNIRRGVFTAATNDFLRSLGNSGLAEVAQAPGFSVVPIAVYRAIPKAASAAFADGAAL
ncbi:hypothetical protein [Nocardia sp. NPDC058633]|uniref:DUF6414 family protein n=1 Tax=Nocardia sp. NPDC058633 TaxID=3346568 RepID=UPI00366385BB